MRRYVMFVVALVGLALVAPTAHAATWDDWGDTKKGTKARFEVAYGTNDSPRPAQFSRNRTSEGKRQVTVRWRVSTDGARTFGPWEKRDWTRIGRGQKLTMKAPTVTCAPTVLEVQLVVRSRSDGDWSKPAVLERHVGARISGC